MRLADLSPHWISLPQWASDRPFYIGVSFLCPCEKCRAPACPTCGHKPEPQRLAVRFEPPIDPTNVEAEFGVPRLPDARCHARTAGQTFESLTLAPSVGFEQIGHWHGHITNGEIVGGM